MSLPGNDRFGFVSMIYFYLSSFLACLAAVVHSYLGEVKFYQPLFAQNEFVGVLKSSTWRRVIRAVWHLPSASWALMAVMVVLIGRQNPLQKLPLFFAGAVYITSAAGNFIATRGRHVGWIVLASAAALLWLGVAMRI